MKNRATIKIKNPYTYPTYTVMRGGLIIKAFYSKSEAKAYRDILNNDTN
jgi:hypothetical protein